MEREAYEQGNLCFRDWEDGIKIRIAMQQENKILKENKKMVKRLTKGLIRESIKKILSEGPPRSGMGYNSTATSPKDFQQSDEVSGDLSPDISQHLDSVEEFFEIMAIESLSMEERVRLAQHIKRLKGQDPAAAAKLFKLIKEKPEIGSLLAAIASAADSIRTLPPSDSVDESMAKDAGCGCSDNDHCGHKEIEVSIQKEDNSEESENIEEDEEESEKIQTPEQENALYESRFNKRNEEVFNKLKKLWVK